MQSSTDESADDQDNSSDSNNSDFDIHFDGFGDIDNNLQSTQRNNNSIAHGQIPTVSRIQSREGPAIRIANAIEHTLNTIKDSTISNENSRLAKRMTPSQKLPEFSGDPLDWIQFKQAYDLSTELGKYSDRENFMRLFGTLKDDARGAAKGLFVAGDTAQEIMRTLEMRFGNSKLMLANTVAEIRALSSIKEKEITLIEFATKFRNSVIAIKSLQSIGYLYSPERLNEGTSKSPDSIIVNYATYAIEKDTNITDLERLSNYLFKQAEIILSAGIKVFDSVETIQKRTEQP